MTTTALSKGSMGSPILIHEQQEGQEFGVMTPSDNQRHGHASLDFEGQISQTLPLVYQQKTKALGDPDRARLYNKVMQAR